MRYAHLLIASLMLLLLAACATGTTMVLTPPETTMTFNNASIEHGKDTVTVDAKASTGYESKLDELLFDSDVFAEGSELTVRYRFIQFDPGSQAARYFVGMGVGKGSMTIETVFLNEQGDEIAKIQSTGEISAGMFGGSFTEAVDKAAQETAEYAQMHFSKAPLAN